MIELFHPTIDQSKAWNLFKHPNKGNDLHSDNSLDPLLLFPSIKRDVQSSRVIPLVEHVSPLDANAERRDVSKVNDYLKLRGLRQIPLFHHFLQAPMETTTTIWREY